MSTEYACVCICICVYAYWADVNYAIYFGLLISELRLRSLSLSPPLPFVPVGT